MMFKKVIVCLVLTVLSLSVPMQARGEDTQAAPLKPAEMLIVYNNNPTSEEMAGVQSIVEALTYLQHSVVFAPVNESSPVLKDYDHIICYDLKGDLKTFMTALADSDKAVFLIGSGGITDYITEKGYDFTSSRFSDAVASVEYGFKDNRSYDTLINLEDGVLLNGAFTYESGTITVAGRSAGLYSRYGSFLYMPSTDFGDSLILASFTNETARWLWPYNGQPHAYAQYIVLNEVYPFTPPEQLLEIVDYFIKNKLPYILSVMPVYENGEYPAMERFCEVLRYAQANGGAVIMHTPITLQEGGNVDQIWEYLTIATEAYANYGVYPLGIQVPESFMFTDTSREIIRRYSTIFWYKDDAAVSIDLSERFNTIYSDGHNMIGSSIHLDELLSSQIMVHSTATYIDLNNDFNTIKEQIDEKRASGVPLKSLWEVDNTVYGNSLYLYTLNGQVYLNNKKVTLDYTPFEYENNYDYDNGVFHWIAMDLKGLNEILILIVLVSSALFTVFIIRARQFNRKKFLYPKEGEPKK